MLRRILPPVLALLFFVPACSSSSTIDATDATTTTSDGGGSNPADESTTTAAPDAPGKPTVVVPDGPAPTELEIDDIIVGDGKVAAAGDLLIMHYVGVRHSDGGEFDASWNREGTFSFTLGIGQVIQGWDQGIEGMQEGGRRLLSIPSELAYGSTARGEDIPADSALVFVVDLVQVLTPPDIENVAEPVTELEVTVLEEGDGQVIEAGTVVELHYRAIVQTTGEVFASSWESNQPAGFEVAANPSQTIPAWDIGLIGKKVGDTVRMVIPPGLGIEDPTGQIAEDATIITELTILGAR